MLNFFRRLTQSKAGAVIAFIVLGVIALAFAASDITGLTSGSGGGVARNDVAEVGGQGIGAAELRQVAQSEIEALRAQQPGFDATRYATAGGLDATLERLVSGLALFRFGQEQEMAVSKRSVDGQIASIPALRGPTGEFDQALYESLLRQRGLTDAQIRQDIAREIMAQRLIAPTIGASQVPEQFALPYASLLLERRQGQVGFIPASAVPAGPALTQAELQTFYNRNRARYTVPERRVVRYALVTPEQVAAQARPTEAEIGRAYEADRARYAPSERRTVAQVVVADRAGATALAARVRGGTGIADAARAVGLEATTQQAVDRAAYQAVAGPAAAQAVFSAAEGAVVGPVRGPLGFVVARVVDVTEVPGRTLDQVRGEITAALTQRKTADALASVQQAVDDALNDNATFDEIVADRRLQPTTTRPLLASGVDPENAAAVPDPALQPILQAAFGVEQDDPPQLVATGADGGFAIVDVGQVVPAAPRPLAQIREQVARDFTADRARQAARRIASEAVARAGRGTTVAQALAPAGLNVPAPRRVDITRAQVAADPRGAEPGQVLLFSMAPGTAKLLQAPDGSGYYVVKLDRSIPGDARGNANLVRGVRVDLGRTVGREYAEQFARAARLAVGVEVDRDAVARVRNELTGTAAN